MYYYFKGWGFPVTVPFTSPLCQMAAQAVQMPWGQQGWQGRNLGKYN